MGNFTVQNQEFRSSHLSCSHLYLTPTSVSVNVLLDMDNASANGLIGLGPHQSSQIYMHDSTQNSSAGDPPLDRILAANTSMPPLVTILLDRDNSGAVGQNGVLTIGEVQPGYETVLSQPQLPVPNNSLHWITNLDANGIIGPNGQPLDFSRVSGAVNNTLPVVFDSGYAEDRS
jgi:hypothetical protein